MHDMTAIEAMQVNMRINDNAIKSLQQQINATSAEISRLHKLFGPSL